MLPEPAHKTSDYFDPLLLIGPCTGLKTACAFWTTLDSDSGS